MITLILKIAAIVAVAAISAFCQTTAFVGVNVIPMDRERVLTNQTVIVRDGVVAEIADAKKVKIPKEATRVDGTGKYLIPGLVDMHTHLLSDEDEFPDSIAEDELRVMVANGVTTVRFMIGTPELLALRTRSAKGEIEAPTIYVASPHLTGKEQGNDFVVNTPEEGREAVRKSKAAGYDYIKVTTFVKPEVYEAAVDEAAKIGIRVVGHADSRFVGVERAWKAKQQIEHLDGYMEMLMRDDAPNKGSVSDLYIYNPDSWKSLDYIDENKIPDVARKTVASNPFVDPTQHFMKNSFGLVRSEESIRAQPDFRFYPTKVQRQWLDFYKRNRFLNTVPLDKRARWIALRDKLIKAIYDAGGKILAGSDTPEFLFLYGFSEHRELKVLADAGLPNYAVLAAATRNADEFFGTIGQAGTIEKGKRADLVLLNANPIDNISATENRAGVMLKGKWHTQTELNSWLDESAAKIHNSMEAGEKQAAAEIEKLGGKVEFNSNREVVKVDLHGAKITDADLRHLEKFTELEWLDLRLTPIGDEGIAHLAGLRYLKFLNVFRTNMSDAGLANLRGMIDLETLLMGGTKVTDEGLKNIERLGKLKKLSVFRTAISDEGLKSLEKLTSLETLLIGESKITESGAKAAADKDPETQIYRTNMMKLLIAFSITMLIAAVGFGQANDKDEAIDVVNKLFAGMKAKDAEQIKSVFSSDGQLIAIDKPKDGKGPSKTRVLTSDAFATLIASNKGADYVEYMPSPEARVSGDLAVVSGRYTFHLGDKLSHCGTNTFNLVRTETGWKIANAASTLEFQCERDLKAVSVPKIAADPKDVSTIDGIIKAFYETISGPKGQPRQWGRDRTLYIPTVNFINMDESDGKIRTGIMSHQQYVNAVDESLTSVGFREREISRIEKRFGNVAHIFSTYEFTNDAKTVTGRGVNSIELYWDGTRWWIAFASWDEERPGNPIAKEFLSPKASSR